MSLCRERSFFHVGKLKDAAGRKSLPQMKRADLFTDARNRSCMVIAKEAEAVSSSEMRDDVAPRSASSTARVCCTMRALPPRPPSQPRHALSPSRSPSTADIRCPQPTLLPGDDACKASCDAHDVTDQALRKSEALLAELSALDFSEKERQDFHTCQVPSREISRRSSPCPSPRHERPTTVEVPIALLDMLVEVVEKKCRPAQTHALPEGREEKEQRSEPERKPSVHLSENASVDLSASTSSGSGSTIRSLSSSSISLLTPRRNVLPHRDIQRSLDFDVDRARLRSASPASSSQLSSNPSQCSAATPFGQNSSVLSPRICRRAFDNRPLSSRATFPALGRARLLDPPVGCARGPQGRLTVQQTITITNTFSVAC